MAARAFEEKVNARTHSVFAADRGGSVSISPLVRAASDIREAVFVEGAERGSMWSESSPGLL